MRNTEFAEFLESLNIKLVSRSTMFYYYRIPKDCRVDGLYTDSKSKIYLFLRYILGLLFLACINILILQNAQGPYILNISIPFISNLAMLIVVVYAMIKYTKTIVFLIYRNSLS